MGHKYLFGNTEDQCRIDNLGCAPRGRPTDGPFNHKTGKGYVKGKKGDYHDALFVKRNRVDLLLHEDLGGGFSPPPPTRSDALGASLGSTGSTARLTRATARSPS